MVEVDLIGSKAEWARSPLTRWWGVGGKSYMWPTRTQHADIVLGFRVGVQVGLSARGRTSRKVMRLSDENGDAAQLLCRASKTTASPQFIHKTRMQTP